MLVFVGDLRWSIGHTSLSQEEKEYKLSGARERQWRAFSLPPGTSLEEMEEIWNQLDFGGKQRQPEETSDAPSGDGESASPLTRSSSVEEKESTFHPSFFMAPTKNVEILRELSMRGKVDMELMSEKTKGRPKLVWGELEAYVDQVELGRSLTENKVVEASEVAEDTLVKCEEAVPVDEDIKVNEVAASVADYSQVGDKR